MLLSHESCFFLVCKKNLAFFCNLEYKLNYELKLLKI
jgi:hypothetical protein